ncbi:putative lipid-transfer protein DIR1 [Vicia villosa]|uniref:putative lipid-transfer protein DIR1 n=1 Tax=Vicia villosa TaxID=3911 RepID=UPI00273AA30A|nr:putative lipid-transfer protein DIR1 [Vicia villosa]
MATRLLCFATLMLTASILVLGISAQIECGGNPNEMRQCISFIQKEGPKIPPSESCCAALKSADISCYCKYLTLIPDIEKRFSIEKALYVAKTCQAQNIPTDKCGSYTIPHPPSSKA